MTPEELIIQDIMTVFSQGIAFGFSCRLVMWALRTAHSALSGVSSQEIE
jgi:hypothetical protein